MPLSKEEIQQYSRQILLPEIGKAGQQKLKDTKVLAIGAGGLGCPALQYLVAAGVGVIGIVDYDVVDQTNLQRQILYTTNDLGRSKAEVAAEKLSKLNSHIELQTLNVKLQNSNALELIHSYDVILDCTDNFEIRYLINDACLLLDKPFVYGGIHKFEGQLSVFNYKNGPTYRCAFPEMHSEEVLENCSITGVIGTLPGIVGTLQANEVIKMITGIGEICSGKMFLMNALTLNFSYINIKRNESSWIGFPKNADEFRNKNYFATTELTAG
jgi:adenylyltransferase/sulfurtransferase